MVFIGSTNLSPGEFTAPRQQRRSAACITFPRYSLYKRYHFTSEQLGRAPNRPWDDPGYELFPVQAGAIYQIRISAPEGTISEFKFRTTTFTGLSESR